MLSVDGSIASRDAKGGTAPTRVLEQEQAVREELAHLRSFTRGD